SRHICYIVWLYNYCFLSPLVAYSSFFCLLFYCSGHHRDLHSFPTRRSSDLFVVHSDSTRVRAVGTQFDVYKKPSGTVVTVPEGLDRKSTRLNSSHDQISYAVFCLKKKK